MFWLIGVNVSVTAALQSSNQMSHRVVAVWDSGCSVSTRVFILQLMIATVGSELTFGEMYHRLSLLWALTVCSGSFSPSQYHPEFHGVWQSSGPFWISFLLFLNGFTYARIWLAPQVQFGLVSKFSSTANAWCACTSLTCVQHDGSSKAV